MSRSPSPKIPLIVAFVVVLGLFIYLNLEFSEETPPPEPAPPPPSSEPSIPPADASAPPSRPAPPPEDFQGNPFFRTYGHESQSARDDLTAIHRTLDVFWTLMKNPDLLRVDSNATITSLLTGQHPEKL
ncbi:MAG: hypothetical protein AAGB46_10850 [Verrucomicrobiota bacterium]